VRRSLRNRLILSAAALTCAAAVLPATAGPAVPRLPDLGPAAGAPVTWAARHLGDRFGRFTVETSLVGTHVRAVEVRGGVPVDGTGSVVTAIGGRVVDVKRRASALPGAPATRPVEPAVAQATALTSLGVQRLVVPAAVERMLVAHAGRLVDVYRVSVVALVPARAAVLDVAAADGRLLAVRDDASYADATATVYDPNPVVTKRDPKLRQPFETGLPADAEVPSAELDALRRTLPMRGLDPTQLSAGRLVGPHVNILSGGYVSVERHFDMTRVDPRFEGLMAYAHIDGIQRYFQALGFRGSKGVNLESQEVFALPVPGFDNSFFQPGNDLILLGGGGVDDGEDAEVIVHEYGHAVHHAQVPGWGRHPEGGAMGEGFGDFLAAAYYARSSSRGFQDVCIADWDATTYSDANPPCLRRADSKKRYPDDLEDAVHADGELWSTFLWRIRAQLGRSEAQRSDNVLRLLLTSHEMLSPSADFAEAVNALRVTATAMRQPGWRTIVEREAKRTGFPLS
jgi:hypothetical protein